MQYEDRRKRFLLEAVAELPRQQARAIMLRYGERHSQEETAEQMGLTLAELEIVLAAALLAINGRTDDAR